MEKGSREKGSKGGERNGVEGKMNIPGSCACAAAGKGWWRAPAHLIIIIHVWRCMSPLLSFLYHRMYACPTIHTTMY
jgi:hypothetical protein